MRCCQPDEYGELFSEREARRTARRYTRRGLRGSARDVVDEVVGAGVAGATVLEVGGGVGDLQAELLRAGAARTTNVELSPSWERSAAQLLADRGLAGRVERRVGDFLDLADELGPADVVVLHRVLCCYPDWQGMLGAAVTHADRVVAFTVPIDRWASRLAVRLGNQLLAWRGRTFRAFVHPPARLVVTVQSAGFSVRADRQGVVWRTIVAERREPRVTDGAPVASADR